MRKNFFTAVTALISVILFSINMNALAVESRQDNVLKFGLHVSDIGKMDPHFAAGSQDRCLADLVFNGLLRYQPGNAPLIEPDLAEAIPEYEIIEGKQVWTFKLKKGVMFHGSPVTKPYELTSDDVVYSFKKSSDKNTGAYAGGYSGIHVEKIDRYTVRFVLSTPMSSVLFLPKVTDYGGGFIVSKKAIDAMGYEGFKKHPVGTGPFVFNHHVPKEKIVLEAHQNYFRGRPLLDGVELHFIPEYEKRKQGLEKGTLDIIIPHGTKEAMAALTRQKDIIIDFHGVGEVANVYFNTTMKPFDDIRVRKAMAYALDRNTFVEAEVKKVVGKVYSQVPANFLPGGLTQEDVRQLDLEYKGNIKKAKELLSQAGFPDGFTVDLTVSEKRIYRHYYEQLKAQLSRIGVTCNLDIVSHGQMHKTIRKDPKPMVIYFAWRPNADVYLTRFFHSDSIVVKGKKPDTNFFLLRQNRHPHHSGPV